MHIFCHVIPPTSQLERNRESHCESIKTYSSASNLEDISVSIHKILSAVFPLINMSLNAWFLAVLSPWRAATSPCLLNQIISLSISDLTFGRELNTLEENKTKKLYKAVIMTSSVIPHIRTTTGQKAGGVRCCLLPQIIWCRNKQEIGRKKMKLKFSDRMFTQDGGRERNKKLFDNLDTGASYTNIWWGMTTNYLVLSNKTAISYFHCSVSGVQCKKNWLVD